MALKSGGRSEDVLSNASNWLRLVFHSVTCHETCQFPCALSRDCHMCKEVLQSIVTPRTSTACSCSPGVCMSVRRMLAHYLDCKAESCVLCSSVWGSLRPQQQASATCCRSAACSASQLDSLEAEDSSDELSTPPNYTPESSATNGAEAGPSSIHPANLRLGHLLHAGGAAQGHAPGVLPLVLFAQLMLHSLMSKHDMAEGYEPSAAEVAWTAVGGALWRHLLVECPGGCSRSDCTSARRVLGHLLTCRAPGCKICVPVCQHFARGGRSHDIAERCDKSGSLIQDLEDALQLLAI